MVLGGDLKIQTHTNTYAHTQKRGGLPLHGAHGVSAAGLRHAINKCVKIDTNLNRRRNLKMVQRENGGQKAYREKGGQKSYFISIRLLLHH